MEIVNLIYSHWKDPLYKNSFYLILSSLVSAGIGFFFWIIAARLYSTQEIGLATALISSITVLILLSRLGLDQSLIRFLPLKDKNNLFTSSLYITTFSALIFGILFIIGIPVWSPGLWIIYTIIPLYFVILILNSILSIITTTFIATRHAGFVFIQNFMNGTRILFLIPLVFFGAIGILGSFGIAFLITLTASVSILFYKYHVRLTTIDFTYLKDAFHFSLTNYASSLFLSLPVQILPIMVLSIAGAPEAGIYYITYAITSLLIVIPNSFSTSLFVEGSHGEPLKSNSIKSLLTIFVLLIPCVILLFLYGDYLLALIGKDYTYGFNLMKIMAISTIFYAIFQVYLSIKKIKREVRNILFISGLNFILITGLGYIFLFQYGIIGIGYAWLIGYLVIGAVIGVMVWREKMA